MVYEDRSKVLTDQCNHSQVSLPDVEQYAPTELIKTYPWLNSALFPVQSKSLMYCAIPKVASKTLISLIMYVYIRDIINYVNNNRINTTRIQELVNIPMLVTQLQKNGIAISNTSQSNSTLLLLQTYLHILRFEKVNDTSLSLYLNPWRLSLDRIFPDIQFKSLPNVSTVFSPSFTRALFVRHPFERLASAYKERIATLGKDRIQPEPYYDGIRKVICRRYVAFDQNHYPASSRHPCEDFIPSFEHFIRYILSYAELRDGVNRLDGHWKPYTLVCQVCQFKYNFIGKYETFDDDFGLLLKRLDVPDWNIEKRRGASGHKSSQYRRLYSSLPDDLICKLKKLYKDDFRFFNYHVEDYVNRTTLACLS